MCQNNLLVGHYFFKLQSIERPCLHVKMIKDAPHCGCNNRANTIGDGECVCVRPDPADHFFVWINLGMIDELIRPPSIWLCIDCGRCTGSFSQLVDGRRVIAQVKALATLGGVLEIALHLRVEQANQVIYKDFLPEIDRLWGLSPPISSPRKQRR